MTEARVLADGAGVVDASSSPELPRSVGVEPDSAVDEDGNFDGQVQDTEDTEVQVASLNPESLMQLRNEMTQQLEYAKQISLSRFAGRLISLLERHAIA